MSPRAEETGRPDDRVRPSRGFVKTAFTLVCLGALLTTLFAVVLTQGLEANARDIVKNMLASIRVVGQLERDVRARKILVDDHIFATAPQAMAGIEAELRALDEEIRVTMQAFESSTNLPGEREIWDRTRSDLATVDGPIARALALSRDNLDVEARTVMNRVAGQFALVDQDLDRLIAINDAAASASLHHFSLIRFRLFLTLVGIGLAIILWALIIGRWTLQHITFRENQLTRDAQRLEARNRELDAFAGRVAHDIRGTLTTTTLAMAQLAERVSRDDRAIQILQRGNRKMEALVEDLLTLARVETLVRGHCDPATVVAQVAQDVAPRVEVENGVLRLSVANADVACNEGLLRQAVTNLIENAVKYHRPELAPDVEVSGRIVGGSYDLRVCDNGIGMSKDEAAHAFEPFYRSPRMRDRPGTGLGLSIVNRVAAASGGELSVQSRLGQGSTFVVRLPLAESSRVETGRGIESPE
jgi:signal transduction histidine kinase